MFNSTVCAEGNADKSGKCGESNKVNNRPVTARVTSEPLHTPDTMFEYKDPVLTTVHETTGA